MEQPASESSWPRGLGEMARLVRTHDWAVTPLGAIGTWPQCLRTTVDLLLPSGFPMVVLWGPKLIQIYNDAYREIMDQKHPVGLGQATAECWPEVWHINAPIYERVWTGESVTLQDAPYPITRHGRLEEAWFTLSYSPIRDQAGEVAGILVTLLETTGRVLAARQRGVAEVALRQSEERLAGIFANALVGLSEISLDGRFLRVNQELCRMLGRTPEQVLRLSIADVTHSEDLPPSLTAVAETLESRGSASLDKRYLRPDGTLVWANSRITLLQHGEGQPDTLLVVTVDLTDRHMAEAALRESEGRFRQFADASADALWIRNAETLEFEYVSPAFEEIYGVKLDAILGRNHVRHWVDLIRPEDRRKALSATRRVREGEHVLHAFRVLRSDGQVRWIRATDFPLLDEAGRVERIAGIAHDITEEVQLQERLRVLVAELQHRTRNLMGVVLSVADRTMAGSHSLEDFEGRFRDRLMALARVNGLLARLAEGDRITFDQLLEAELSAHGAVDAEGRGEQVRLSGPQGIRLRSSTVQTLALGLHELATNALKHGALAGEEGRLEVTWSMVLGEGGERQLQVDWRESGVTIPVSDSLMAGLPLPRGYGRELIEEALPYQLGATTFFDLTPTGVHCVITLPVSARPARGGTAKEVGHAQANPV
jgi:PAS domain S-box-containing protein